MSANDLRAPELAGVEIHGVTRGAFIARGTMAAAAVYGTSAVAPFVSSALAQSGSGDIEILNFALTLEYLEAAFYAEGLNKVKLSSDTKKLAQLISDDENQHVAALTKAIKGAGGKPVAAPKVKFPFKDEAGFLKLAQVFEDTGVGAYNGAAPMIASPDILAAAGAIVQIEARHAAAIRLLLKVSPAPDAFDKPIVKDAVLKAVKPFLAA